MSKSKYDILTIIEVVDAFRKIVRDEKRGARAAARRLETSQRSLGRWERRLERVKKAVQ